MRTTRIPKQIDPASRPQGADEVVHTIPTATRYLIHVLEGPRFEGVMDQIGHVLSSFRRQYPLEDSQRFRMPTGFITTNIGPFVPPKLAAALQDEPTCGSYLAFHFPDFAMLEPAQRRALVTMYGSVLGYELLLCIGDLAPVPLDATPLRADAPGVQEVMEYMQAHADPRPKIHKLPRFNALPCEVYPGTAHVTLP